MKKTLLTFITSFIFSYSHAQWSSNGSFVTTNSSVGIGCVNPATKLDVNGTISTSAYGNILTPNAHFTYFGQLNTTSDDPSTSEYFFGMNTRMGTDRNLVLEARTADGTGAIVFKTVSRLGNNGSAPERMRINSVGNVSIGTTDSHGYKLAVVGGIIAESVRINVQSAWPDYVFTSSYKMPSLSELDIFIRKNRHLPEIPSSKEVKENGLNLGDINAKLLQKIEELTLYLIQQNNEIKKGEEKSLHMESLLQKQQEEIDKLKSAGKRD